MIENNNHHTICQKIGIGLHETYLFSGIILSNITMNNPDIKEEMAILKKRRQLISLARNLDNSPKILILDEAA
ncbi:hypothetical protein ACF3NG_06355 [Aerococcaceae bacterium WGS1372]